MMPDRRVIEPADTLSSVRATSHQRTLDLHAEQQQARCAWCDGAARPLGDARLAICLSCGTGTTYPPPDDAELERAYSDWYRPASGRFSAGGDRVLALSRATLARRLDRIAPPGPILDVGCGEGWLLKALRARGREAVGLERTGAHQEPLAAASSDAVLDIEVTEFGDRLGGWAAVVFWHSLEHLPDAGSALDRAAELLAPGGVLVVAVPNLSSLQARAFGMRWFHLDLPRHLVHLPAPALIAGLSARGFAVERVSHWRAGQGVFGWLQGIVGSLPGRPDLYSAIRRREAREDQLAERHRMAVLAAASVLAPFATALSAAEVALRAGGTVYIEARRR
jgi:2-polyprenyl-3-methyl-5-hydroxy-6-metoxy-1,4-benzoquinol methylase